MNLASKLMLSALISLTAGEAVAAQEPPFTPQSLRAALAAKPAGDEATELADKLRAWFGKDNLAKGAKPKVSGLNAAWAIEAGGDNPAPAVVSADGTFRLPLARVGTSDVYAASVELPEGTGMRWAYEVGGKRLADNQLEVYSTHPDSIAKPDVPKGVLTQQPKWKSTVFAGTERDWWVYVPAQYKAENPACVMVFQDGGGVKDYVPVVFDNPHRSGPDAGHGRHLPQSRNESGWQIQPQLRV